MSLLVPRDRMMQSLVSSQHFPRVKVLLGLLSELLNMLTDSSSTIYSLSWTNRVFQQPQSRSEQNPFTETGS